MSAAGGHSVQHAVKRMLDEVISNDVAKEINWTGQHQKRAFRNLHLKDILESKYGNLNIL